jgi:hypothetical protein
MAPKGINRPGYSSSKAPKGINRPGYSSSKAPKGINRPGYSQPEKDKDRSRRREQQKKEERDFIQSLKIAPGTTNLLQEQDPVFNPMTGKYERTTLADKRIQLANKYGPTFREILGDVGSGLRSMSGGLGDFIARGGVTGSVLSNIYNKFKSGAKTGIETVGGLYDNLRNAFKGESQFSPSQAQGGIYQGQPIETTPQFPYNFETTIKPRPDPLQPSEMSQEQFMESYPELYSQNPLFRQQNFEPVRVSNMDMSGVMASNMGQNILGNLQNLQNLAQQYNLDSVQFDPFKRQIGFQNQFMIDDTPVNYNFGVGERGLQGGIEFAFKDGGSVNKHSGLGYMLK